MPELVASRTDPSLGLRQVLLDDGTADPATDPGLPEPTLLAMYRELRRLRLLDEKMLLVQRQGRIGFYGEVKGQEATPIAAGFALRPDDWVFPGLREGAVMLVRGFPLATYLSQCWGNGLDVQKGRQMPSHYSGRAVHQVSWSSCIGPQIPQAVGAAWAAKLQKKSTVVAGFFGDGATSQPDFHNAMNFAAVYKVPAVLVCQNNHWAISVPSRLQTASPTFAAKAHAYGMPGVRVDGNDVLAVYSALHEAAARAREGLGPTLVECVTDRMGAHSSSDDPTRYRAQDEVDRWAARDPVARFRRYLAQRALVTDATDEALLSALGAELSEAIAVAEAAPALQRGTLFDDVYHALPWHLAEQRQELLGRPPARGHG
ncbi:MAG: 3-methyl-2-oxobutanoate dehydrogenase [Deltaproteobacteria bacterium]|nr:3-methyl-2-oxobutanoate dehydrogenase [Deltaproteobacteria bacterium]